MKAGIEARPAITVGCIAERRLCRRDVQAMALVLSMCRHKWVGVNWYSRCQLDPHSNTASTAL